MENFGVYAGRQVIPLTPEKANKPIILFGGLNGGGKTTLLDAVQLAFYGPRARCSNRGRLAYKDYLREAIHRGADPTEGASIEIEFRRAVDGEMKTYRLIRSWRENARGIEDHLEVRSGSELDLLLSEHWDEYIESYIPNGIAHLFFFDAEQIKELADGEHAAEILGTAIHSLLGLDLVEQLETDLLALERRKRTEGKAGKELQRLKHTEEEVARMEGLIDEATQTLGHLKNDSEQLKKKVGECEEQFRLAGGDLFLQRKELETEEQRLERAITQREVNLRELAEGAAPLLLVSDLLEETEKLARREVEARKAEVILSALEERDRSVVEILRRGQLTSTQLSRVEQVLREDRDSRRELVGEPCSLSADEHMVAELRHLRTSILPEIAAQIRSELAALSLLQEEMTRIEAKLGRTPDQDAIRALQRELETLREQLQQKLAEVAAQESKLSVLGRQLEIAKKEYARSLGEEIDTREDRESNSRVLKYSEKARSTLEKFRVATIRKHVERIERLVLESFVQLIRKRNFVTSIKIHPDTYRVDLTGLDGKGLPMDRLSAGERQLLATSLLWGLARASGRPIPTIIDTPLGRLDSSHRRHLVERYFPVASRQVILLSTDEEIDKENLERLRPYVDRCYRLEFDDSRHATTAIEGYFWNHETTR